MHTLSFSHRTFKHNQPVYIYRFVNVSPSQVRNGADTFFSIDGVFEIGKIYSIKTPEGKSELLIVQGDHTMRTLTSIEKERYESDKHTNN